MKGYYYMDKLNILFITSECSPYAKTGGLADVVESLTLELKEKGHDVRVVMPKYRIIHYGSHPIEQFHMPMGVWMGDTQEWCSVDVTYLDENVPVYLLNHNVYYDREGIYHNKHMKDYGDNPRRFAFLTRAALQLCEDINFRVDIVHVHDWQTALAPAYLKKWHWNSPVLGKAASVLTIHNLAYQGVYPREHYSYLGLGEENFHDKAFESWGKISFLKGGIYFADMVNTVSPTFAKETLNPEQGFGLSPYLSNKANNYVGILNGIDYDKWNPKADSHLPARAHFSSSDLSGKAQCKRLLQERFYLELKDDVPIIGLISRFVGQKGLDLLAGCIERVVNIMHVQIVILGSGENDLEHFFGSLPITYSGKVGSYIGYNNNLAHLIEAGADFFLMPSYYEPCGLNQIYSLHYGTLPIVHATGGLEDTVEQYSEKDGSGTGFKFYDATEDALYNTIGWAVSTYYDRKEHMKKMIKRAMDIDFSWEKSTKEYEKLYKKAIKNKTAYNKSFK